MPTFAILLTGISNHLGYVTNHPYQQLLENRKLNSHHHCMDIRSTDSAMEMLTRISFLWRGVKSKGAEFGAPGQCGKSLDHF